MQTFPRLALGSLLSLALGACGGGSPEPGGGAAAQSQGTLVVTLQDTPVDHAEHVFVTVARVEVFRTTSEGEVRETVVDTPAQYDLLELQHGVSAVLGSSSLEAGEYHAIRLIIAADSRSDIDSLPAAELKNHIVIDGTAYALVVPSGAQTGIKLQHDFTLSDDAITVLSLDFDVRRSVHQRGHQPVFNLRPVVRMIDTIVSGRISGTVTTADASPLPDGALVSAQQGGVEVASAFVDAATGAYLLGPLLAGTYDLVASAPGFGFAARLGVEVVAQQESAGNDFALTPAASGQIDGTLTAATTLLDAVLVMLRWEGFVVASAAPDLLTGEYTFGAVPEGTYSVEVVVDGSVIAAPAHGRGGLHHRSRPDPALTRPYRARVDSPSFRSQPNPRPAAAPPPPRVVQRAPRRRRCSLRPPSLRGALARRLPAPVAGFAGFLAAFVGSPSERLSAAASLASRRARAGGIDMPWRSSRDASSYFPLPLRRGSIPSSRCPRRKMNSTRSSSARITTAGPFERKTRLPHLMASSKGAALRTAAQSASTSVRRQPSRAATKACGFAAGEIFFMGAMPEASRPARQILWCPGSAFFPTTPGATIPWHPPTETVPLAYTERGHGAPILLIHGFPFSGAMWHPVAELLAREGRRVLLPDLRGFGASTGTPPTGLAGHADDLVAWLDALGLREPLPWVGFSMGGYVALEAWRRHPERIGRLGLVDTRAGPDDEAGRAGRLATALRVEREGSVVVADAMLPKLFASASSTELRVAAHTAMKASLPQGVAAALRAMAARADSRPTLATIRVPTAVVVGAEDAITPPAEARGAGAGHRERAPPRDPGRWPHGPGRAAPGRLTYPRRTPLRIEPGDVLRNFVRVACWAYRASTYRARVDSPAFRRLSVVAGGPRRPVRALAAERMENRPWLGTRALAREGVRADLGGGAAGLDGEVAGVGIDEPRVLAVGAVLLGGGEPHAGARAGGGVEREPVVLGEAERRGLGARAHVHAAFAPLLGREDDQVLAHLDVAARGRSPPRASPAGCAAPSGRAGRRC